MRRLNQRHGLALVDYDDLYRWSIDEASAFWSELWDYAEVKAARKGERVLVEADRMTQAQWFPDARLNFAENLLSRRDDKTALVFRNETHGRQALSYAQLYKRVAQLAAGLKDAGVGWGDRVAGFMPNCIDAVVAMLATTSLGAVWSSCSPDFGIHGVLDRFGQIEPKVLFTTDGYCYNGKTLDSLAKISEVVAELDVIERVVVVPFISDDPNITALPKATLLSDFEDTTATEITFVSVPFNHPLYVMYSSGTTGVPKCIIHSVGGTLLQHLKEHKLHTDLGPEDVLFYYTTCGWMMWNWLVSGLASGVTLVLFDGSPFAPQAEVLWDIAEQERISVFGTSAKYIAELEKAGVKPRRSHDLSSLRAVLSTGSPLAHESFDYVYRDIKEDLLLASISGGTDIISCFALGCPIKPVYRGELQCLALGMAVAIYDDSGRPVEQQKGELVCTQAFPAMPIGFWNDPDGVKYHDAYFGTFPNTWAHGDFGEITAHRGLIIHGRSDAVLNPGGVRIGTAEIYRQVEKVGEVLESIAVGQEWRGDVRVVLFVVLRVGLTLDSALIDRIKRTIRIETTPRHVPAKIIQVAAIPRTTSGKIVELAVRKIIHGQRVKNQDALANPEALALYQELPELQN
jgi:acetoacetyl-CoA synthetase